MSAARTWGRIRFPPRRFALRSRGDNRITGGAYIESSGEQIVVSGDACFRGIEAIAAAVDRTDANGTRV